MESTPHTCKRRFSLLMLADIIIKDETAYALIGGVILGWLAVYITKGGSAGGFLAALGADFKNVLAYFVVTLAFVGIFFLSWKVITAGIGKDQKQALDAAKFVFGAVLPLLGTWVGTVLAHYFQKENLAAATQSITDLAKGVTGNTSKLGALAARDFMIPPNKIITLPAELQNKPDSEILLSAIVTHLKANKRDRLPLFTDNKASGTAKCVVHLSRIEKFLADKVLNPVANQDLATLKLSDLITTNGTDLSTDFKSTFSLVKESSTLADAKAAMEGMTNAPGVPSNCYDIFVTPSASATESVIGWITNDIINENAKV